MGQAFSETHVIRIHAVYKCLFCKKDMFVYMVVSMQYCLVAVN